MASKEYQGFKWAEMAARQEKNPTLDRRLIKTLCPTGGTITRRQNPHQPYNAQEIADHVIAAQQEGAAVAHLHTRNADGTMGAPSEVMMPEGSIIGLGAGGRNWLPLSTFAILMGADSIRVWMEDHIWMYPHKDERIRRSADAARRMRLSSSSESSRSRHQSLPSRPRPTRKTSFRFRLAEGSR